MKILVADDSRVQRRLLQDLLESWNHSVILADTGDEAFNLLSALDPPQLAILDWEMPGKTGPEICAALRKSSAPYIYTILITAKESHVDIAEGLNAGADDFVSKPPNPIELQARVRAGERILASHRQLFQAREALEFEATHDSLTGLWNRRAILKFLENEVYRSERESSSVGVLMVDIDDFKRINDEYGHLIGDGVLKETARIMSCGVRPYDFLGRCGGEEFLVVLPGAGPAVAGEVAERMRLQLGNTLLERPLPPKVTVSIGVAVCERGQQTVNELIQTADSALYMAKAAGKNRMEMSPRVMLTTYGRFCGGSN